MSVDIKINLTKLFNTLINETFSKNLEELENRSRREEADLSALKITTEIMKKSLRECEIISTEISEKQKEALEKLKKPLLTDGYHTDKAKGPVTPMKRQKSVGKQADLTDQKTLTRNYTTADIKRKDDVKKLGLSKSSTKKELGSTQTTINVNKSKELEKSQTKPNLTRKPTEGKLVNSKSIKSLTSREAKEKEDTLKKNPSTKSIKKISEGDKTPRKTDKVPDIKPVTETKLKDAFVQSETKNHPSRLDNISNILGEETQIINHEPLLTCKDDDLILEDSQPQIDNSSKLDYVEILDDKWALFSKYFNRQENIQMLRMNKTFGKTTIANLISEIQKEIGLNEVKIKEIREKNPIEITKNQTPFALTRGAIKAIDLLNENMHYKLLTDGDNTPVDDVVLIYRVFFQLLNMAQLCDIKENKEFWKQSCLYLKSENEYKIGLVIQNLVKNIDFSNENIYKINKLLENSVVKINPNYFSKLCGTTGLFIFFIKDALEYAGVVIDKKTSPSRLYKNYMYSFDVLQQRLERLKKIKESFFS